MGNKVSALKLYNSLATRAVLGPVGQVNKCSFPCSQSHSSPGHYHFRLIQQSETLNDIKVTPQNREEQIPFLISISNVTYCSDMLSGQVRFVERRKVGFERQCTFEMVSFLPFPMPSASNSRILHILQSRIGNGYVKFSVLELWKLQTPAKKQL